MAGDCHPICQKRSVFPGNLPNPSAGHLDQVILTTPPSAARRVQEVANVIVELGVGEMLFTKNLRRDLRSSVLNAVQYHRRARA